MADLTTLLTRLRLRLPTTTDAERQGWLEESAWMHSYTLATIPTVAETVVVEYARYLGLAAKAAELAESGSLDVGGKISINKSGASGNYERLIQTAQRDYTKACRAAGIRSIFGGGNANGGSVTRVDGR